MGKHSGERVEVDRGPLRKRLLLLAAGATVTLVAWGYLVWAAIEFGGEARTEGGLAWVFFGLATVGATACLFMSLILGSKLLGALGGEGDDPKPATLPGGRRAKR